MDNNINTDKEIENDRKNMLEYNDSDERKKYSAQRISNDVGDITQSIIQGRNNIEKNSFYVG